MSMKPLSIFTSLIIFAQFPHVSRAGDETPDSINWRQIVLPSATNDESQRILKFRTRDVIVVLKDSSNKPFKKGKTVKIELVRHQFLFGDGINYAAGFEGDSALQKKYRDRFIALFNYATVPFYWDLYEKKRGITRENTLRQLAQWCVDNKIRPKGHPLIWHQGIPSWAKPLSGEEFKAALEKRVKNIVTGFSGLIDTWDVFNESLIGRTMNNNPLSKLVNEIGAVESIRMALVWARSANPSAFLLVNDFNTSTDYDDQILSLIKQRQAPDAMGIQAHFHKGAPPDSAIWSYLQRVKKLGIPIHVTELSINSGALMDANDNGWSAIRPDWNTTNAGEQYQVKETLRLYRLLFSHPSVEAITWWEFKDPETFAPTGLLSKDMGPKPAYWALMKLIHDEWSTRETKQTDFKGSVKFRGFFGHYQLSVDGKTAEFDVQKGDTRPIGIAVK